MTAAEVLAAERRIDAKAESVQRELFYAARAFRRLCERVDRLSAALPAPAAPPPELKSSEVEKLKSGCRQLNSSKVEKLKSSEGQPTFQLFNSSTFQPFNSSTAKGGEA